jgi:hypothetical protein
LYAKDPYIIINDLESGSYRSTLNPTLSKTSKYQYGIMESKSDSFSNKPNSDDGFQELCIQESDSRTPNSYVTPILTDFLNKHTQYRNPNNTLNMLIPSTIPITLTYLDNL